MKNPVRPISCLLGRGVQVVFAAWLLLSGAVSLGAVERFVSTDGSDQSPGTEAEPFRTIQHGVNQLNPGDTLTIAPGEYYESVTREDLGSTGHTTTIRAAIPGTAVLRGDIQAPAFKKLDGARRTYVANLGPPMELITEVDTLRFLREQSSVADLDFTPGCFFYDEDEGKLYISTTDFAPPDRHHYAISIFPGDALFLVRPHGVVIDGLAVRGFNTRSLRPSDPGKYSSWGIILSDATDCVIRNCWASLNGGGIVIATLEGRGNLIEFCTAFGNSSPHSAESGNIVFFGPREDRISNCLAYRSQGNGFRLYGSRNTLLEGEGSVIEECVGWGNNNDFFVKGGGVADLAITRRSVAEGRGYAKNIEHTTFGDRNQYAAPDAMTSDSVNLAYEPLNPDDEFVDPLNHDYRLQASSKLRGTGPNGTDRGAWPYEANVFFVRPDGDDGSDGLSVQTAWATVGHALRNLNPGATLYLMEGTYSEDVTIRIAGDKRTSIRARGRGDVVLGGAVTAEQSANLELERLMFTQTVATRSSSDLAFRNCVFGDADAGLIASDVLGLRIGHCEFPACSQGGLELEGRSNALVENTFFGNSEAPAFRLSRGRSKADQGWWERIVEFLRPSAQEATAGPEIIYSDYNAFASAELYMEKDGKILPLKREPQLTEQHSKVTPVTVNSAVVPPQVADPFPLLGQGRLGVNIGKQTGVHRSAEGFFVRMTPPEVISVTSTTANLEWLLTGRAACLVAWGATPECENEVEVFNPHDNGDHLQAFSLTGLKPDTTYYFQVRSLSLPNHLVEDGQPIVEDPEFEVVSFQTTKTDPAPVTYHVSPDGSDSNSGLSRLTPFRTIARAASAVRPGDSVEIGGGTYTELVRMRATGEVGRPITFRAARGEQVILSGNKRTLDRAIIATGKKHLRFDGLFLMEFGLRHWHTGAISLLQCDGILIERCFYDGRGSGYQCSFLNAQDVTNLTIRNCVVLNPLYGMDLRRVSNVLIENNVFARGLIEAIKLGALGNVVIRNNIFTDSSMDKRTTALQNWSGYRQITEDNNLYYLRIPDDERNFFGIGGYTGPKELDAPEGPESSVLRISLAEFDEQVMSTTSWVGDPDFPYLREPESIEMMEEYAQRNRERKTFLFPIDVMVNRKEPLGFQDFFAANPEVNSRGVGLQQSVFENFNFPVRPDSEP